MKLSDFTMKVRDASATSDESKYWNTGSRANLIGVGTAGGKKYQVKLHAGEPKWFDIAEQIRRKKDEKKALDASDDENRARLDAEIETLERTKAKRDKADAISDKYVECKSKLIRAIASAGDPLIVGPVECWKQPISFKNNNTYAVEATPWLENVAVGFTTDAPIVFNRDLDEAQQREIIATLADRLAKLHAAGAIHGDLKQGNTLITKADGKLQAALIDFDAAIPLSALYSDEYPVDVWYYMVGGTYFSPETYALFGVARECKDAEAFAAFDKRSITPKADIYSLGFTVYEYYYGAVDNAANLMPFVSPEGEMLNINEYGLAVRSGYTPKFPDSVPDFLYGMLNWMLAVDPAERPTAEQVRDIFRSGDASAIPSKYTRNPLHPEHRDVYKATIPEGVGLSAGRRSRYMLTRDGVTVNRTIEQLLSEGIVAYKDASYTPPPSASAAAPDADKAWERDGGGALPACVRRAAKDGKYTVTVGTIAKTMGYGELRNEGIICSTEEASSPWPCDAKLRFAPGKKISRNFGAGKGPGYYVVSDGPFKSNYTAEDLVKRGYATMGVTFTLHPGDRDAYDVSSDTIPAGVKSVVRNTIQNHCYVVEYESGERKKLMIEQMEAQGFVRKK